MKQDYHSSKCSISLSVCLCVLYCCIKILVCSSDRGRISITRIGKEIQWIGASTPHCIKQAIHMNTYICTVHTYQLTNLHRSHLFTINWASYTEQWTLCCCGKAVAILQDSMTKKRNTWIKRTQSFFSLLYSD